MKVKIIYNSWFANMCVGKNITLYPFIFMMDNEATSRETKMLNHEWVHVLQIRRVGWFKFYASYLKEYVVNLFKYKSMEGAYLNISYEREAYALGDTLVLPEVLE